MRNLFCTLLFFILTTACLRGQYYSFDAYVDSSYAHLNDATNLTEGIQWFNFHQEVPLGFTFEFMGQPFDRVTVWNEELLFDFDNEDMILLPFYAELNDLGWNTPGPDILSPILVKTEGAPGNRIFKTEYVNAGFFTGTQYDSVNVQCWLYESGNVIEFRIGPNHIAPPVFDSLMNGGIIVGLANFADDRVYVLHGDPAAPVAGLYSSADSMPGVFTTPPPAYIVYRFTPQASGAHAPKGEEDISVFPNPCSQAISIRVPEGASDENIELFDVNHLKINNLKMNGTQLNLDFLSPGIYWLKLQLDGRTVTKKVVKF